MIHQIVPPLNYKLTKIDHCCACGIPKKEKNKPQCVVYGSLVNGGKHQYMAFLPPKK